MKTSARDIHMFIAGVFSLSGFYSLCWLVLRSSVVSDGEQIVSHVLGCFELALGIAMFVGHVRAVRIAEIFLWFLVIGGVIVWMWYCYLFPTKAMHSMLAHGIPGLVSVILLGLMVWSRSRRFT